MNKKILYIELSTAHTEIIASFVEALVPENKVVLLIHERSVSRLNELSPKIEIISLQEKKYLNQVIEIKKKMKPDLILLNSAQGRKVRNICLRLLFDKTPIIGIHHNAENIIKSFTQKIIHLKIKTYVVLADFIKKYIQEKISNSHLRIESFYPLVYPFSSKSITLYLNKKYISLPGVLEQDRRDYLGLIELVKTHHLALDSEIQFVLLGNSNNHNGPEIKKMIHEYHLQSRFILFDEYVEDSVLIQYVVKSFAVMPLLHPGTKWFAQYFETKISGAYSLAFSFDKILFMHDVFKDKEEFKDHGFFYNENNFSDQIKKIVESGPIQKNNKFQIQFQKQKLLRLINDA